jgi:hypothetical protein
MSTINSKNVQVGTSGVANQNFTLYQPDTPDGTVRLGVGNSGVTTSDVVTVTNAGNVTVSGVVTATTLSGAITGGAVSGTTGSFSGNLSFNSGYGSAAVAYGCRAWVNFNGTGTVAIRGSGNVSSITDNGTGYYTVNFTTSMPDANYAICTGGKQDLTYNDRFVSSYPVNASSCRVYFAAYSIGLYDPEYAFASIIR